MLALYLVIPKLSNSLTSSRSESRSYIWDLLQLRSKLDLGLLLPAELGIQGKLGKDLEAVLLFWDIYALRRKLLGLHFERI